eukprot:2363865-Amphidinium_carterae.1
MFKSFLSHRGHAERSQVMGSMQLSKTKTPYFCALPKPECAFPSDRFNNGRSEHLEVIEGQKYERSGKARKSGGTRIGSG